MLTSALAGCGGNGTESTTAAQAQQGDAGNAGEDSGNVPVGDPITLTFAHGQAEGHPYQQAALYFKELVEEESGGSITVVVSPNGTLGDERECVESLQMGTLDITAAVASALIADGGLPLIDWEADWAESGTAFAIGMVVAAALAVAAILVIKIKARSGESVEQKA